MLDPTPAHHPEVALALTRGHLENLEREFAHLAYTLANAPAGLLPDPALRRLFLANAVVGQTLADLPPPPISAQTHP